MSRGWRGRPAHILVSIVSLLACVAVQSVNDHHAVRILLFGDSLTDRLERLLHCPVSYIGLSGWTTEQFVRARNDSNLEVDTRGRAEHGLEKTLVDALREGKPFTHVAIFMGTNDMYNVHETGHQHTADNIRSLHTAAHLRGAATLALTVPQHALDPTHEKLVQGRNALNDWLRRYAEEKAASPTYVRLVDVEKMLPMHGIAEEERKKRWESDGIHFTPYGSDEIANLVFDALAQDKRVQRFCNTNATRKERLPMGVQEKKEAMEDGHAWEEGAWDEGTGELLWMGRRRVLGEEGLRRARR